MSLYQSNPHTPRPKPPAQARRSNAADKLLAELALPPPYTSAQPTPERIDEDAYSFPVSSPVTTTAQMLGLPVTSRRQVAMSMSHGVSHQSREELKKLLAQTELLIQDRERGKSGARHQRVVLACSHLFFHLRPYRRRYCRQSITRHESHVKDETRSLVGPLAIDSRDCSRPQPYSFSRK